RKTEFGQETQHSGPPRFMSLRVQETPRPTHLLKQSRKERNPLLSLEKPECTLSGPAPLFSTCSLLQNPFDTAIGAPTSGPGPAGPYTKQAGVLAYYKNNTNTPQTSQKGIFNPCNIPTALFCRTLANFSLCALFSLDLCYGWALDLDDFTGTFCKEGKYPLITSLKKGLGLQKGKCVPPTQPSPQVTEAPCTTGGIGSGSWGSGVSDFCAGKANGIYVDPTNKSIFYNCINGKTFVQSCDDSLMFDTSCSCCNWP
uniref:chitinase n=1 Tax=Buteo japonicus TaxID=224669 RepID=A0A8C0C0P5_9AVES